MNKNFPREEFERYVRAMPQGEAQTALIFLVNFLADYATAAPTMASALEQAFMRHCDQ